MVPERLLHRGQGRLLLQQIRRRATAAGPQMYPGLASWLLGFLGCFFFYVLARQQRMQKEYVT